MEKLKVFKFGGGVLKDPESFLQLLSIVKAEKPKVLVVSAIGKTTNALRDLAEGYIDGGDINVINYAFQRIDEYNGSIVRALFGEKSEMNNIYNRKIQILKNLVMDKPFTNSRKMIYDRIMVNGEIISSQIVHNYLESNSFPNELVPADSFIVTDLNFGSANVLREESLRKLNRNSVVRYLTHGKAITTQGFIGRGIKTDYDFNFSGFTTLGREGSDYTAALIAGFLDELKIAEVEELVLWKDVEGVANRNPKEKSDKPLVYIPKMSYEELRKQISHGGSAEGLVHPKTLNELEPFKIPLRIKSFWNPEAAGTLVS